MNYGDFMLSAEYIYGEVARRGIPKGYPDSDGYLSAYVTIAEGSFNIRIHKLIFFIENGYLPEHVDHKDGNILNNEPSNLRAATKPQNHHNSKKPKNNTSGVKGVSWNRNAGKWEVKVCLNRKSYSGGLHLNLEDARIAAESLRKKLHGDFARNI